MNTPTPVCRCLEALRAAGISLNQGRTLVALTAGSMAQVEIAAHLGVTSAAVIDIADVLERKGYAQRLRVDDRRQVRLGILPAGVEAIRPLIQA